VTTTAENWLPPDAYPAELDTLDDGRSVLTLPDLQLVVVRFTHEDAYASALVEVRRNLRHRAKNRQLFPFASKPETLGQNVVMVKTARWDQVEVEEDG
jgi:hypothetical protein